MEKYLYLSLILLFSTYILAKTKKKFRIALIVISNSVAMIYILWRFTVLSVSSLTSFIFSLILLLAEIVSVLQFFVFQLLFIKEYKLNKKELSVFNKLPMVDILICTYNEPISLIEKNILANLNLKYPKDKYNIYICDDGSRDEIWELCKEFGVEYIKREDNEGAKAGNINNALKYLKGELFVVLDADMLPKEEFLQRTVGYFINKNMAFVQTPQVYYNPDMYQYNFDKNMPNEQDFFMREIQEARAAANAVLHIGTNALFRRSCVEEIGGYPTFSITEDMAVGMLLQAKGYDSVFVNEELVLGLSATTYADIVKQRDRWCRGNIQVMKKHNPLFTKGLDLMQRIAYFDGVLYWFTNVQKLIYIICPIIYLLTNIMIISANIHTLAIFFIPFLISQVLIFYLFGNKTRTIKWSHFYEIAMSPHLSFSVFKELLAIKTTFKVTPKESVTEEAYLPTKYVLPHIVIGLFSIIAVIVGLNKIHTNLITLPSYLVNIAWIFYNLIGIVICIVSAYQKPLFRKVERVVIDEVIDVSLMINHKIIEGSLIDLSEKGLAIKANDKVEIEKGTIGDIKINFKGETIVFKVCISRNINNLIGAKYSEVGKREKQIIMKIYMENLKPYYDVKRS